MSEVQSFSNRLKGLDDPRWIGNILGRSGEELRPEVASDAPESVYSGPSVRRLLAQLGQNVPPPALTSHITQRTTHPQTAVTQLGNYAQRFQATVTSVLQGFSLHFRDAIASAGPDIERLTKPSQESSGRPAR